MRTLLFDIDGTLIDAGGAGRLAMDQAFREAFSAEPSRRIDFGGRTDRSLLSEMLAVHDIEVTGRNFGRLRDAFTECLVPSLRRSTGRVLPGVELLLRCLSDQPGVRLWCMTGNLAETADRKLRHFELHPYFEQIIGGDHDMHRSDLARRAKSYLASRHGENSSENVVVIGDTVADIQCARAIGAKVVACCTGCHSRATLAAALPCELVDDLSDLPSLLRLLLN